MVYIQALSTNCILAPPTMIRARKIPLALSVIAFIWFVLLQTGSREELSSEDTFDLPGDEGTTCFELLKLLVPLKSVYKY